MGDQSVADSMAMAINGATLQMFNHGIITGGLFFLVGVIYERAHTRDLGQFGGLSAKLPYFYGIMMVVAFASLGLPGLAGFWAEFFTFRGAFDLVTIWAAIGVIGIVVTAGYILYRIIQSIFLGEYDASKIDHWTDMQRWPGKARTDRLGPLREADDVAAGYPDCAAGRLPDAVVELLQPVCRRNGSPYWVVLMPVPDFAGACALTRGG